MCGIYIRGTGIVKVKITGHVPSIVTETTDPTADNLVFKVIDHNTRSEASLDESGSGTLRVEGAEQIGRSGERRLLKTLKQRFQKLGLDVTVGPGEDERGEDSKLHIGDRELTVQITEALDRDSCQDASRGIARKDLDALTAVALLRAAIERKKAKIDSRELPKTVLAINARHTPQAAAPRVLDSYMEQYGCPVEEFGFASVWVVGSSTNYCERLGGGEP